MRASGRSAKILGNPFASTGLRHRRGGSVGIGTGHEALGFTARNAIIGAMGAEPLVGVVMGSRNDYAVMQGAVEILREFGVPYEARVVSAHRTPDLLFEYAETAVSRGLRVIIAGAGGAAHLPGMLAAKTVVPVLGGPIAATALQGM